MEYSWSDQRETQTSLVRISKETRTCKKRSVAGKSWTTLFSFPFAIHFCWLSTTPFHLSYIIHSGKYCSESSIHANKNHCFFRYPTDLFRPLSITLQFLISTAMKCLWKDTVEHENHWKESKQKNRLKIRVLYLLTEWCEVFFWVFFPFCLFFINSAFHFLNVFFLMLTFQFTLQLV